MAMYWKAVADEAEYVPVELIGDRHELTLDHGARLLLARAAGTSNEAWAAIVSADVTLLVSGEPAGLGMRALNDRDELLVLPASDSDWPPRRYYFSTERLARIEEFSPGPRPVICARCKLTIDGGMIVRCPNPRCRQLHHATDDRPCWTYHHACGSPGCGQATALDAGYSWTPNDL